MRTAQCEQLQKTLEAQAVSLTEKEALIERQESAILTVEIALTAASAEIEEGEKCIVGEYHT